MTWEEQLAAAEAAGHVFEADPTHPLSAAARITCVNCDSSMLCVNGNVYGSATEQTCEQGQEAIAWLSDYLGLVSA